MFIGTRYRNLYTAVDTPAEAAWLERLCERRRGRRREACIGAATMLKPWTLRLILNAAALAAASPTLHFIDW